MATAASIKGEQANQVLNSPVFIEAYRQVADGIMEAIADAPVDDAELRNQLGLQLGAAKVFKEALFEYIDTAALEADEDKKREENKARTKAP
jgi:hypothetical protein